MSRSGIVRLSVAACAATLVASGCAAGFNPYTSPTLKPADGANYPAKGGESPLALRHAFILGPGEGDEPLAKGDDAAMYVVIVNETKRADKLTEVTTSAADDVTVGAVPPADTKQKPKAKKAAEAAASAGLPIPAPASGKVDAEPVKVGQPPIADNAIVLTGLSKALPTGAHVKVTFQFQRAGTITMDVPVVPRNGDRENLSPAPMPTSAEETPSGGATPSEGSSESPTGEGGASPTETTAP